MKVIGHSFVLLIDARYMQTPRQIKEPIHQRAHSSFYQYLLLEIESHRHSLIPTTIPKRKGIICHYFLSKVNYCLKFATNIIFNQSHANDHISYKAHASHVHNTSMHIFHLTRIRNHPYSLFQGCFIIVMHFTIFEPQTSLASQYDNACIGSFPFCNA